MKKQFFKISSVKVYATALFTSLIMLGAASQVSASEKNKSDNEATVTYAGTTDDLLAFNINYNNQSQDPFVVELTDETGNVLYQKKFNDKVFSKTVYLKNIGGNTVVNFAIRSGKNVTSQKFDIGTHVKSVSEVVVTKL